MAAATVAPDKIAHQILLYRVAARLGVTEIRMRRTLLEKKHNALAQRLCDPQADYLRWV